ncbi:hypothetical protein [Alteribacillus sp. YIM 98480]|uniref:hypothetical protein n=1 Tax=Alteribacillus sp. YIM 98480 TaxID=2606599 RepID=UPI00131D9A1D|nr:hypothetical protein [Alteribacillus sp. YIM 98480]
MPNVFIGGGMPMQSYSTPTSYTKTGELRTKNQTIPLTNEAAADQLKIRNKGRNMGIRLVDPSDSKASAIRIYNGSTRSLADDLGI